MFNGDPAARFSSSMVPLGFFGLGTAIEFFRGMYGRRLAAGFVNFKNEHWGAYIWDRRLGQLFYFDLARRDSRSAA